MVPLYLNPVFPNVANIYLYVTFCIVYGNPSVCPVVLKIKIIPLLVSLFYHWFCVCPFCLKLYFTFM